MKLKLFSVQSGNRKPRFEDLERSVNEWLADHPDVVVENSHPVGQPNIGWGHLGIAVWYSQR